MDNMWITCTGRKKAMKRFSALPLAMALLVLIGGLGRVQAALAQAPEHRHGRFAHSGDHLQRSLQQLGLNRHYRG
jgi:hypothetical protein